MILIELNDQDTNKQLEPLVAPDNEIPPMETLLATRLADARRIGLARCGGALMDLNKGCSIP